MADISSNMENSDNCAIHNQNSPDREFWTNGDKIARIPCIQVKKAVKAGNSSAVILPRAWLNKEVRVELVKKSRAMILSDVLNILDSKFDLGEIIGIYLVGSYARGDEDANSDMDILVITKNSDMPLIKDGIYNIITASVNLIRQKMRSDLLPIGAMIKEQKTLLNSEYIKTLDIKVSRDNVKWYLDTTKDKLGLIKKIIIHADKRNLKNLSDQVAYTLILRIRTLLIIKNLIEGKNYSKKELFYIIKNLGLGMNAYERYISIKNNLTDKKRITLKETVALNDCLKSLYDKVKDKVEKL